ncbi:acyltransferase [Pseudomonas sp. SWRI99]|uniref:acyltransferase family protein n=1 Tax=Pseudomonas sp. SWRI99 TaxID=2745506 RepID=UPI0016475C33|nr:acyltransferase [Pseudomonas sp. SWRI99]MBC3778047.1 acyltransferase [Pseudomonas sp. SWRI99]
MKFVGADGLRGIACLIVLVLHSYYFFFDGMNGFITGLPKIGVWLFFVLSAFLLTVKFESEGFSARVLLIYLVGRVMRILPLYIIFVLVYWWWGTAGINTLHDLTQALTLGGTYAHLWTVPVEFKYYIFLPLVAYLLIASKQRFGVAGCFSVGLLLIFLEQILWPYWMTPIANSEVKWYLSSFAFGSLAAMLKSESVKWANARNSDIVALTFLVVVVLISPYSRYKLFGVDPDQYLVNKFVYLSALCAVLMLFVVHGQGMIGRVVRSRLLRSIGFWSYPIYLVHWLIVVKLSSLYPGSLGALFLAVMASLLAGGALHYSLELPLERFRRWVLGRLSVSDAVTLLAGRSR